jgi:Fur family zinc uptake transcriptional regulator
LEGSVTASIERARKIVEQHGEKLTPLRARVLGIVMQADEPLSAYEILDRMAEDGRKPAPPTVYRSLDFLIGQGLIHKIHSRNSFVACCNADEPHDARLFICRTCGIAREVTHPLPDREVAGEAMDLGFEAERVVVEVEGLCRDCRKDDPA